MVFGREGMNILEFYNKAKKDIIQRGYGKEIEVVENRKFEEMSSGEFFWQYVYVVFNAGMKNQVAESMYRKFAEDGIDAVKHLGKKNAIKSAMKNHKRWFRELKKLDTIIDKLLFLKSLPWIGDITKYHLARNLGIDVAKPDRHLMRIAKKFGYSDVQQMCKEVSEKTGDRIGTVDLVLWRYCNLNPKQSSALEKTKLKKPTNDEECKQILRDVCGRTKGQIDAIFEFAKLAKKTEHV